MIDPAVRRARPHDVATLVTLEGEARTALSDRRGGGRWLDEHPARGEAWTETIDAPDIDVVVGSIDDVVVGYLVLRQQSPDVAVVDEVYVTPGAREVGIGDALLADAAVRARDRGARFLEATALPGDRETKNLYERAGITARLIVVSTRLDE